MRSIFYLFHLSEEYDLRIFIYDTTLRDGEQTPGVHFGKARKLDIAKRLAKTGVDILEAGFPASSSGDFEAVHAVAEASGSGMLGDMTVSALARMVKTDIDIAAAALDPAKKKRLHVFIATSDIHLENKLRISRNDALDIIDENIRYAKKLGRFDEIEFSAEDATRTDPAFLIESVRTAVECGADVINIPDTVGYTTPGEYSRIIRSIRENIPGRYQISVFICCKGPSVHPEVLNITFEVAVTCVLALCKVVLVCVTKARCKKVACGFIHHVAVNVHPLCLSVHNNYETVRRDSLERIHRRGRLPGGRRRL